MVIKRMPDLLMVHNEMLNVETIELDEMNLSFFIYGMHSIDFQTKSCPTFSYLSLPSLLLLPQCFHCFWNTITVIP